MYALFIFSAMKKNLITYARFSFFLHFYGACFFWIYIIFNLLIFPFSMNKIGLSVSHFSTCIKQAKLTATNHLTRENIKNINNRLWRKKKKIRNTADLLPNLVVSHILSTSQYAFNSNGRKLITPPQSSQSYLFFFKVTFSCHPISWCSVFLYLLLRLFFNFVTDIVLF